MKSALFTRSASVIFLLLIISVLCCAQTDKPAPSPEEKAEQIVKRAIEAVGGNAYLSVQTITGRGYFTDFKDGVSGIPMRFVDYIAYPDRERTEFSGGGQRIIQTNDKATGWIYDAAERTLKDQTAPQLEDFQMAMITSMENLLRGWWRGKGAKLTDASGHKCGGTIADGEWTALEAELRRPSLN